MPHENAIKKTALKQFFKGVVHEQPWSSIVCLFWWFTIVSSFFLDVQKIQNNSLLSFSFPLLILFSFSPPARWGLLDFITVVLLLLLLLLHHLCIHFRVHFRLANSSPISSPTSARSGHCWTSTAGFRSEWARLDLNRKVLSAVGTAGPQPGTFRAQWAPLDLSGQMECQNICQKDCPNICQIDCQNICHIECRIECQHICKKEFHIECQNICQIERQNVYQIKCWKICRIEYQNRCQAEC